MDNALAEIQRFSERILSTTPDIIYIYDLVEKKNIYVNQRVTAVLGYSASEIAGMDDVMVQLCHPEDLPRLQDHYRRSMNAAGGRRETDIRELEYRILHADGGWRWLMLRESEFQADENGRITQVLGVAADITGRMKAEAELRGQEQRWQLALEGTNDGIWDWNAITGEVFYSARWKEMLGFKLSEIQDSPRGLGGVSSSRRSGARQGAFAGASGPEDEHLYR